MFHHKTCQCRTDTQPCANYLVCEAGPPALRLNTSSVGFSVDALQCFCFGFDSSLANILVHGDCPPIQIVRPKTLTAGRVSPIYNPDGRSARYCITKAAYKDVKPGRKLENHRDIPLTIEFPVRPRVNNLTAAGYNLRRGNLLP